jgi:hypothetical protein
MLRRMLIGFVLCVPGVSAFAQAGQLTPPNCLHGSVESPADRARRQQAIQYAVKVNLAEMATSIGPPNRPRMYRPLNELPNLPALPPGFDVQLHTDGASYLFSVKDARDPCHYALYSDQDKLIYEAIPRTEPTLLPLATK